jgi:acyl carrier protein
MEHPSVAEAVVIARSEASGDRSLVAYVVPKQSQTCPTSELRSFLKTLLPDYMLPAAFVFLDKLPLTPGGKVDRSSLPSPDDTRPELETTFEPPRTPTEKHLAQIWAEVLGLKQVGIQDNFFDLGGHSLRATQIISRLRNTLQLELPMRSLFEAPTIAGLAQEINRMKGKGELSEVD